MKQSFINLKWSIIALLLVIGQTSASAETYRLEQVTSVEAGSLYVFEQDGHVMNNTIASDALETTDKYDKIGLTGNESYVWTLESNDKKTGFCLKNNHFSGSNKYLVNTSSSGTGLSMGTKNSSAWEFLFQEDNTAIIRTVGENRYLGYTDDTSYKYRAYSEPDHSNAIVIYKLVDENEPTVAAPTFTPAGGTSDKTLNVEISCATEGASIYYTVDGTEPSESSTLYNSPIEVTQTTTIKAVAVKNGITSLVATATFTITSSEIVQEDGVFDFTIGYDYGSGKSDTSENTNINEDEKIWTSGNVILKTSGRILWADRKVLILHVKGSGSSDKESACAISVDGGGKIKEIEIEGEGLERLKTDVANSNGSYVLSNNTWKGDAPMVTLKHNNDNGVITIKKIKVTYIPDFVNVNIGTAEYITFCSEYALDFAGVTAYVVSEVNEESVKLEEIKVAPANTPVILNAGAGEYRLGTIETSIDDIEKNYLKVSDGTVTGREGVYALAKKDGVVGFYVVDDNVVIPKGKCYLETDVSAAPRLGFNFGEADAIGGISADASKGNGIYYNLSGQRVMKPSKGIYILNNKKVLVK